MGKTVNITYDDLKTLATKYKSDSEELIKIKDEISGVLNSLSSVWNGVDSTNFTSNSEKLVNYLTNESKYLELWNNYLSKTSNIYTDDISNALSRFKSVANSYEIKR